MDAHPQRQIHTSCPFADSRPDGCICIALREPKRVSIDYQARFCLTERHTHCRRFQKAVPDVPEAVAASGWSNRFERGTFQIAGAVAFSILLLAAAFTFRGTWSGWFDDSSADGGAPSGAVVTVQSTTIGLGSTTPTVVVLSSTPEPTSVPVLSASPTSVATARATSTSTPTAAPTVAPTPTPSPSPTPSPTPQPTPSPTAIPTQVASAPTTHVVTQGETLTSIGQAFGVSPALIAAANDIGVTDVITTGSTLNIPSPDGHLPPEAPALGVHIVTVGDTLSSIAGSFGVTTQNVMAANGITDPNHIELGQVLIIPKGDVAPAPTPVPQTTYTVQHGDTLYSIAQRFGVSIEDLMAANGLTDRTYIETGQVLVIP